MRLSLAFLLGASSLCAADLDLKETKPGNTEQELMTITHSERVVKARLFITDKRDPTVKNDTRNWLVDLVITDKDGKEIGKNILQCFEIGQTEYTVSSYITFNPHEREFRRTVIRIKCNLSQQMSIKGYLTQVDIVFVLKGESIGDEEQEWKKGTFIKREMSDSGKCPIDAFVIRSLMDSYGNALSDTIALDEFVQSIQRVEIQFVSLATGSNFCDKLKCACCSVSCASLCCCPNLCDFACCEKEPCCGIAIRKLLIVGAIALIPPLVFVIAMLIAKYGYDAKWRKSYPIGGISALITSYLLIKGGVFHLYKMDTPPLSLGKIRGDFCFVSTILAITLLYGTAVYLICRFSIDENEDERGDIAAVMGLGLITLFSCGSAVLALMRTRSSERANKWKYVTYALIAIVVLGVLIPAIYAIHRVADREDEEDSDVGAVTGLSLLMLASCIYAVWAAKETHYSSIANKWKYVTYILIAIVVAGILSSASYGIYWVAEEVQDDSTINPTLDPTFDPTLHPITLDEPTSEPTPPPVTR